MLAVDIIARLSEKGITLAITPDGEGVEASGDLDKEARAWLKFFPTELRNHLKYPSGPPDPIIASNECSACGATMEPASDETNIRRATCPAGCTSGFMRRHDMPHLSTDSDLVIPFSAPAKYHHWKGGQSAFVTLAELKAPLSTWRKYAQRCEVITDDFHGSKCKTGQGDGFSYCLTCGMYAETNSVALKTATAGVKQ